MIKKSITSKLATKAAKLAIAQDSDSKSRRRDIIAFINNTLSEHNSIHVYTRTPKSLEDRTPTAKKKEHDLLVSL